MIQSELYLDLEGSWKVSQLYTELQKSVKLDPDSINGQFLNNSNHL